MTETNTRPVLIAVDPHKASWTAAAVGAGDLKPLGTVRTPVNRDGYRALQRFAKRWPGAVWAIEGAGGPGAPLVSRLHADGIEAVDVPPRSWLRRYGCSRPDTTARTTMPTRSRSGWPR